jgi:hypothetical protein
MNAIAIEIGPLAVLLCVAGTLAILWIVFRKEAKDHTDQTDKMEKAHDGVRRLKADAIGAFKTMRPGVMDTTIALAAEGGAAALNSQRITERRGCMARCQQVDNAAKKAGLLTLEGLAAAADSDAEATRAAAHGRVQRWLLS